MYGIDKWQAVRGGWRISEAALLWAAVFGGSIGAWLGVVVFHHKTLHASFRYGVPLILLAQVALAAWIILGKLYVYQCIYNTFLQLWKPEEYCRK